MFWLPIHSQAPENGCPTAISAGRLPRPRARWPMGSGSWKKRPCRRSHRPSSSLPQQRHPGSARDPLRIKMCRPDFSFFPSSGYHPPDAPPPPNPPPPPEKPPNPPEENPPPPPNPPPQYPPPRRLPPWPMDSGPPIRLTSRPAAMPTGISARRSMGPRPREKPAGNRRQNTAGDGPYRPAGATQGIDQKQDRQQG
jgi:hypothetical protein